VPELPETETIARDLDGAATGMAIVASEVIRPDVLRGIEAAEFSRRIDGAAFVRFWRRAKSIIAELSSGDRLVVTPRFTGALLIESAPAAQASGYADYNCLRFDLNDGRTLRYRDVRRLGTVALMATDAFQRWEARLGPEPLDPELTDERFSVLVRASGRAIKTILMDQHRMAGVGNIYANEALWHAGIRPTRRGRSVTKLESVRLLSVLREILTESIALRGTSFRDYRDAFGGRGGYVERLQVYGRDGEPCFRCGAALQAHHTLEGRVTIWCRACQK
jgi:formamidopyrimidine-DNA glycosylase